MGSRTDVPMVLTPKLSGTGEFEGVAGRIVREARGPGGFLTGLMLPVVVVPTALLLRRAGYETLIPVVIYVVVAIVLARFALQGYFRLDDIGSFRRQRTGWETIGPIVLRYSLLNLLLVLPPSPLRMNEEQIREVSANMLLGDGMAASRMTLIATYFVALVVAPPILLAVSVSASRISDLASPAHWRRIFSGRLDDLFLIYVLSFGSVAVCFIYCIPVLALMLMKSAALAAVGAGGVVLFAAGYGVTIVGRLAGWFAALAPPNGVVRPAHSLATAIPPGALTRAARAKLSADPASPAVEPTPSHVRSAAEPPPSSGLAEVEAVLAGLSADPGAAWTALDALQQREPRNPLVLYGICLAGVRTGHPDAALAEEIVPLLLARGHQRLAAEIYCQVPRAAEALALASPQLRALAAGLKERGELEGAVKVWMQVLLDEPSERESFKRLVQVAEEQLPANRSPETAARIYRFLLERCPTGSFEEYLHNGLREAERRAGAPIRRIG